LDRKKEMSMKRLVLAAVVVVMVYGTAVGQNRGSDDGSLFVEGFAGYGTALFAGAGVGYLAPSFSDAFPSQVDLGVSGHVAYVTQTKNDFSGVAADIMGTIHYRIDGFERLVPMLGLGYGLIYFTDYDESERLSRSYWSFAVKGAVAYYLTDSLAVQAGVYGHLGEFVGGFAGARMQL
jgi:hypothetical protein